STLFPYTTLFRSGREDRVDTTGVAVLEILLDEGADLLRADVIGVVIAGREHVGADHHAAAHFRTKTFGARGLKHVVDRSSLRTQAVAHAVIAREIGGSLRGRHD